MSPSVSKELFGALHHTSSLDQPVELPRAFPRTGGLTKRQVHLGAFIQERFFQSFSFWKILPQVYACFLVTGDYALVFRVTGGFCLVTYYSSRNKTL